MLSLFGKINVEQAKYTTEEEYDKFSIRTYKPAVAVVTDCPATVDDHGNKESFQRLAKYIGVIGKPQNEAPDGSEEKISMTAPVINTQEENDLERVELTAPVMNRSAGDSHQMAFILPSSYTIDNAPKPTDLRVKLQEIPQQRKAALSFSGTCSEDTAQEMAHKLLEGIRKENIPLSESTERKIGAGERFFEVARYNPPWTIPFLRTNEVLIPLD
uniref:SOUL heme-binding protein n=1 Tax=Vannella robusta TaxID=1487602 RepID=A0A7S4MPF3_9EUKA|mmetsp:Transcript_5207/g.6337  ORF Transcript_5207/g.6337 Transcript_5207/m.6337 type:complete len:215 (+) Transcript_5207:599-1243(+)